MEWSSAKNYTIIMLIILNIFLFVLNVNRVSENMLDGERIQSIKSLLEENNIEVECEIPKEFFPKARIEVNDYRYDYIELEQIFLKDESNIKRTDVENGVVLLSDCSNLTIKGSKLELKRDINFESFDYENVKAYCDNIVESVNNKFGKYKFHSYSLEEDRFVLTYYEKADGYNVFSNYIKFYVGKNQLNMQLNFSSIGKESGKKTPIYASDEILYSFKNSLDYESNKFIVTNIEFGYKSVDSKNNLDDYLVPFYRIFCNNKEYFVNAYSGECFWILNSLEKSWQVMSLLLILIGRSTMILKILDFDLIFVLKNIKS